MATAIIGGIVAGAAYTAFTTAASWALMTFLTCVSIGMSIGALFIQNDFDYSSSPTYSFGSISNSMSQNLPIPIVYGGYMRVAGNIIYQAFESDKKKVQTMYVVLSEGEIEDVNSIMANDQTLEDIDGCSVTVYKNTDSSTHDERDPDGTRPYPNNIAMLCMTLKAGEKLSGNPTITSLVKGVKVWTPSGIVWSNNPIWCAIDLLAHPRYGLGLCVKDNNGNYSHPDWDKIDYNIALQSANYCDGLVSGDTRFELTYVLDTQKPIRTALYEILNTCRGYIVENGKIELHIDAPVTNATRVIDEAHIVQDSFSWWQKADEDVYNQIAITWTDPDNSYDQVTDYYKASELGYSDETERGVVLNNVQLVGIAKQEQADRLGWYLLKSAQLIRNFCSFRVGIKDFDVVPGEVIAVSFPSFTGWSNKWFRIISIKVESETEMTITACEYVAECYGDGAMTSVSHISTQRTKDYTPQEVTNLTLTEELDVAEDGQYRSMVIASWTASSYANSLEVWYKFDNEASYTMAATLSRGSTEYKIDATTHSRIYVKIITVSTIGVHGSGVTANKVITGDTTPPAPPTNLTSQGGFRIANIKWTDPSDFDLDHIDVYRSSDLSSYLKVGTAKRDIQEYIDTNLGILTTYGYKCKAVDKAGNESVFSAVTQCQTTAIDTPDISDFSIDEQKLVSDVFGDADKNAISVINNLLTNTDIDTQNQVTISEHKEIVDALTGKWYVKIDSNGKVAGISLYNDSKESDFTVVVDKFKVCKTDGTNVTPVFVVDSETGDVVIDGDLIANGSITGDKINAASQITLGNGGELVMGNGSVMQMASGAVTLDSENGVLQIKDPNNLTTGDYIRIETGDITTFSYINGAYKAMRSLRKMAFGTADTGTTVSLRDFPNAPTILVSPSITPIYQGGYESYTQKLYCNATQQTYNSNTGVATFMPEMRLVLSGSAETILTNVLTHYHPNNIVTSTNWFVDNIRSVTYTTTAASVGIPATATNLVLEVDAYGLVTHNSSVEGGARICLAGNDYNNTITIEVIGNGSIVLGSATIIVGIQVVNSSWTLPSLATEPTSYYQHVQIGCTIPTQITTIALQVTVAALSITSRNFSPIVYPANISTLYPYSASWVKISKLSYSGAESITLSGGSVNYIAIAE